MNINLHFLKAIALLTFLLFVPQSDLAAYNLVMSTNPPKEMNDNTESDLPETVSQAVMRDVAENNQISVSELEITEAREELWSNGCLGLAKEGEFCTQAMVPGWRVFVTGEERTWIYRTDGMGRTLRLEQEKTINE